MEFVETTLFALKTCPHCIKARLILKKAKVNYKEILWDDDNNDALFKELKIEKVPVLYVPSPEGVKRIDGEDAIETWTHSLKKD